MLALARFIWYPHIHSEIVAQAHGCRHCIEKSKNLKPVDPKVETGELPPCMNLMKKSKCTLRDLSHSKIMCNQTIL